MHQFSFMKSAPRTFKNNHVRHGWNVFVPHILNVQVVMEDDEAESDD